MLRRNTTPAVKVPPVKTAVKREAGEKPALCPQL